MHRIIRFLVRHFYRVLPTICAILLIMLVVDPAFATTESTTNSLLSPGAMSGITSIVAMLTSGVILIIVFFSLIFALSLGYLMDSTFILDSGMGDTLHLVWEVMRNFVNVSFIIILLIIAIMVIVRPGDEGGLGLLKKILPKFIFALIFVNLTFFGARFILTTNDVLATAIFSLPQVVSGDKIIRMPCKPSDQADGGKSCSQQIISALKEKFDKKEEATKEPKEEVKEEKLFDKIESTTKKLFGKENWSNQAIGGLANKENTSLVLLSNMIDLENIPFTKGQLGDKSDLLISSLGSIIMAGVVGIIFFMLFLAFVVRMVVLWICIAISPIAALGIVLKEIFPSFDMGQGGFDPVKVFISHAFMPTMVAIPLSIGMIMIFANNAVGFDLGTKTLFSFAEASGDSFSLLWWIASIVIVWFGTNTMIKKASPDFAAKLTDGVHGGVNKFVGGAAGTLKYMPILPSSMGGSVSGLMGAPQMAQGKLQTHNLKDKQALAERMASVYSPLGYKPTKASAASLEPKIVGINTEDASDDGKKKQRGQALDHVLQAKTDGDLDLEKAKITAAMSSKFAPMFTNVDMKYRKTGAALGKFLEEVGKKYPDLRNQAVLIKNMQNKEAGSTSEKSGKKITGKVDKATRTAEEETIPAEIVETNEGKFYAIQNSDKSYTVIMETNEKEQLLNNIETNKGLLKKEDNSVEEKKELTEKLRKNLETLGSVGSKKEREEKLKGLSDNKNAYDLTQRELDEFKKALRLDSPKASKDKP